jgi:hypothetical protein
MRVAIVGSRGFMASKVVEWLVIDLEETYGDDLVIVSGGARGADQMATFYAAANHVKIVEFLPDWKGLGKRAGYARNVTIVENSDRVIALFAPGPRSPGTTHTVNIAKRKGIPVDIFHEGRWTKE